MVLRQIVTLKRRKRLAPYSPHILFKTRWQYQHKMKKVLEGNNEFLYTLETERPF
jgi:hypothetical protein